MPRGKHTNHARGTDHPRSNHGKILSDEGYVKLRVGIGHPLVRALLEGRKTQTRRIVKAKRLNGEGRPYIFTIDHVQKERDGTYTLLAPSASGRRELGYTCPYGKPGDRLWVREAWKTAKVNDHLSPSDMIGACREAGWKSGRAWAPIEYLADSHRENWDSFLGEMGQLGRYRNAQFMPRDYSRITLEITEVRVQRLQEISEADAVAEGIYFVNNELESGWTSSDDAAKYAFATSAYRYLWESINGAGSWAANPWVWAVSFKVVQP